MAMGSANRAIIINRISERMAFAVASMSGVAGGHNIYGNKLPEPHKAEYAAALRSGEIRYTVFSYSTPIAWVLTDGTKVMPDVKYSTTTSNHQGIAREALLPA
jgi:hypothetical protein